MPSVRKKRTPGYRRTTYVVASGLGVLVLFVLVLPIYLDLRSRPRGPADSNVFLQDSWTVWPATMDAMGCKTHSAELGMTYEQMARFANQSAYATMILERKIKEVNSGRSTDRSLYEAAWAAHLAVVDEKDGLLGLVVPARLKNDAHVQRALRCAQLASLAKLKAVENLQAAAEGSEAWDGRECQRNKGMARELTADALNEMRMSCEGRLPPGARESRINDGPSLPAPPPGGHGI